MSIYTRLIQSEDEEDKKKRGLTPSQISAGEQKKKNIYERLTEPVIPKPEPPKPPGLAKRAISKIAEIPSAVGKFLFGEPKLISPVPEKPILPTETKLKEEGLKNYLTFPSLYPNPDVTSSATLNRSQDINLAKLYFDTTNTIKKSTTDFLTYHPAVNDVLNNYMKFSEKVNNVYNEYFPPQVAAKGLARGLAKQVIGFTMPNPKETLEQVLPKPVNVFGRTIDTVSEFVGMVLPYIYGEKILESGLTKLALNPRVTKLIASSSIWGIIGQTSSSSQTELQKRVAKLPNDTVTGALLSIVPSVRYGEGIEKFATSFVKGGTFNVALFSTNAYIDALIEGAKPKEAFEMAKQTAIMQGLIYTALTGVNAFNYNLQPKTKTGNKVFAPNELRDIVSDPKAQNTPEGKQILKIASEAERANKNVEINADAIRNSWLGEKLAPLTIEGKPVKGVFTFNYRLVDRPPEIPTEKKAVAPVETGLAKPAVITPSSLIELAKQFTSAKDFASELGTKPTSQVGEIDANRITPRDPVDQASIDKIKADIEAGKKIEPIIATEENGVITTTDGSNRIVAYQQLGQEAPVIITKGNVEELKTIEEVYKEAKVAKIPEKKVEEFKVGDIFDPQGNTNMVGKVTITGIEGNTLKFTDSKGTEFSGMQRSLVRSLVEGGSWKKVSEPAEGIAKAELPKGKITSKDLVESKTPEEIQTKLQRIFGTYEELEKMEDEDEDNVRLLLADEYMADLERAATDRDYDEAETLFANLKKEIAKRGIIGQYEKVLDISRREARPRELPGAIQVGEGKPGVPAEAVVEPSEVAGREYRKRYAEPRKRPTARITIPQQVELNKRIEALIAEKGEDSTLYSDEEKELLKQYTGVGGLEKGGAEGRGLLDEYYTPVKLVNFVWDQLQDLGIKLNNINVLEPSVGIGRFFENVKGTNVGKMAFEINKTAATITKVLYPDAEVENTPFESLFITERGEKKEYGWRNVADVVVGNPPYGEHRGKYLGLGEEPKITKYEEYFLKKGLDTLSKGGVLAYIMPSSFLRGEVSYAKQQIAEMAKLERAYRLPNKVFPTTEIGTDILIFRKVGK
ncbi:hypothetical protein FJZ33_02320, partial [Candidatus Poribacteria bacterium]|nr:hypothetical protein [Candidatus Poribacteria bacterium]